MRVTACGQRLAAAAVIVICLFACPGRAQPLPGAPAPSMEGGVWTRGEAQNALRLGRVHLIAFWTSDIAERADALPLMLEMAQADEVVPICVVASDKDDAAFARLARSGDAPRDLRIVKDHPEESTGPLVTRWLSGLLNTAYPLTFIVDRKGQVAFVGDITEAREVLPEVLSGKRTGASETQRLAEAEDSYAAARDEADLATQRLVAAGDFAGAAAALDAVVARHVPWAGMLQFQKFTYLLRAQQFDQAYTLADKIAEAHRFDPNELNTLAWFMVDEEWIAQRDLDRALGIAKRSNELSGYRIAAYLDTLARVHFERGDLGKAFELQSKALSLARPEERDELQRAYDRYRAAMPR
jgi:tetratricopeptide (TPR) repeat protein